MAVYRSTDWPNTGHAAATAENNNKASCPQLCLSPVCTVVDVMNFWAINWPTTTNINPFICRFLPPSSAHYLLSEWREINALKAGCGSQPPSTNNPLLVLLKIAHCRQHTAANSYHQLNVRSMALVWPVSFHQDHRTDEKAGIRFICLLVMVVVLKEQQYCQCAPFVPERLLNWEASQ